MFETKLGSRVIYNSDLITVTAEMFPEPDGAEMLAAAEEGFFSDADRKAFEAGAWKFVMMGIKVDGHGMILGSNIHNAVPHGMMGDGTVEDAWEFTRAVLRNGTGDDESGSALWELLDETVNQIQHAMAAVVGAFVRVPNSPLSKLCTWILPDIQIDTDDESED